MELIFGQGLMLLIAQLLLQPKWMYLPQEILLSIFRLTQPHIHQYNPSVILGPRNPWLTQLRTKKALVLVCKAWSAPATVVLYDNIALRRMGQISALANTLLKHSNLAVLVRSLCLESCVMLEHCADAVREDLGSILSRCTKLRSFSFHAHESFHATHWDAVSFRYSGFHPTWFLDPWYEGVSRMLCDRLESGLHSLDIAYTFTGLEDVAALLSTLAHGLHLTSLTLGTPDLSRSISTDSLPTLQLPELRSLRVHTLSSERFNIYVSQKWVMPKLVSFTCDKCYKRPIALLEAHGSGLTYLYLRLDRAAFRFPPSDPSILPRLSELCPRIEHLVLNVEKEDLPSLSIHSSTLHFLDILHASFRLSDYTSIALAPDAHAPSLKCIRFVEMGAWFYPLMAHPSLLLHEVSSFPPMTEEDEGEWEDEDDYENVYDNDNENEDGDEYEDEDEDRDKVTMLEWTELTTGGIEYLVPGDRLRQKWWCVARDPRGAIQCGPDAAYEDVGERSYVYSSDTADSDVDMGTSRYSGGEAHSDSDSDSSSSISSDDEGESEHQLGRRIVLRIFRSALERDSLIDAAKMPPILTRI